MMNHSKSFASTSYPTLPTTWAMGNERLDQIPGGSGF